MRLLAPTVTVCRRRLLIGGLVITVLALTGGSSRALAQTADPYRSDVVQTSADLSQRLTPLPALEFGSAAVANEPVIDVNAGIRYQSVAGFGAAMTDTSAWLIERHLAPATRAALMGELFGPTGIRLNFLRIPMGASDFTRNGRPYTYDDQPAGGSDPGLAHFSIAHDRGYILPALRQARAVNPAIEFLASPWSPPAWMKTNGAPDNAGERGLLLTSAYGPWAQYFARFIQAYARAGVPIAAITPQNEPTTGTLYPGLNFPAASESSWIAQDLAPALATAGLHPKIYAGDLGWGPSSNAYATTAVFGPAARNLTGISWHCYFGAPGVMTQLHQVAPRLDQIVDECSPGGISPTPTSEIVIASLRDWASTVALWNLALDPKGGPAELPNHGCAGCVGTVTINPATETITPGRSYYQLGQASAFVAPGAQRIASRHFVSYSYPHAGVNVVSPGLDDVAVRNPDGSLVLIAYNNSVAPIRFAVRWRARALPYELPPGATVSFVWNRR